MATESLDLGKIVLKTSTIAIEDLVVRPLVEVSPDKLIYNITSDPERSTASMTDILKKVPMLTIALDDKLEVNNEKEGFIVTRNGRRDPLLDNSGVPLNQMFDRLSAMGFVSVEVLLAPPAKYGDVKYVVNIITDKTNRVFGAAAATEGRYVVQDGEVGGSQGITGSAGRFRFSVTGDYLNTSAPSTKIESTKSLFSNNTTQTRSESLDRYGHGVSTGVNISLDISSKQFISGSFKFNKTTNESTNFAELKTLQQTGVVGASGESLQRTKNTSMPMSGNIDYQIDFAKLSRSLVFSYVLNDTESSRAQRLDITDQLDPLRQITDNPQDETLRSHIASIYYADKFGKKVSVNAKVNYLNEANNMGSHLYELSDAGQQVENPARFASTQRTISRTDGSIDLRWEPSRRFNIRAMATADYSLKGTGMTTVSGLNNTPLYIDQSGLITSVVVMSIIIFPSKKSKTPSAFGKRLNLLYRISSSRPSSSQLSNYVDQTSSDYIITGNPNLGNEVYHIMGFSMMTNNNKLNSSIFYQFSNNRITKYWYVDEQGRTVETFRNGGRYRLIGLRLSNFQNLSRTSRLGLSASTNYTQDKIDNLNSRIVDVAASINFDQQLFKQVSMVLIVSYMDRWGNGYNSSGIKYPVTAILEFRGVFKLGKSASLDCYANLNNLFVWKSDIRQHITGADFEWQQSSLKTYVPLMLGAQITFGKFNVKPPRQAKSTSTVGGFSTGEAPK